MKNGEGLCELNHCSWSAFVLPPMEKAVDSRIVEAVEVAFVVAAGVVPKFTASNRCSSVSRVLRAIGTKGSECSTHRLQCNIAWNSDCSTKDNKYSRF